jgi:hypothetical protein
VHFAESSQGHKKVRHHSLHLPNFEFPPWDHVAYKDQIKKYFRIVTKLNVEGFNPKVIFPTNIVSDLNIIEVFGLSSKGFKTTNLHLHCEMKRELLRFYW